MKKKAFFLFGLLSCGPLLAQTQSFPYPSVYLPGYERSLHGEEIEYLTLFPVAQKALLVRSLDEANGIAWETAAVPADPPRSELAFVMLAGLDVNTDSHRFTMAINGRDFFTFGNPAAAGAKELTWSGPGGATLTYTRLQIDRFGDYTGFLIIRVPAAQFPAGKRVRIQVRGETANSRSWFMVFQYSCRSEVSLAWENAIVRVDGQPSQILRAAVMHLGPPARARIRVGGQETRLNLDFGYHTLSAHFTPVQTPVTLPVTFATGDRQLLQTRISLAPVSPLRVVLLPHSHVDIGYTELQTEVEKRQWQHLEQALDLGEAGAGRPPDQRAKWNSEVLWAVDSYLAAATPARRERLLAGIRTGTIGLDGMYANLLTGLCSPEEWVRMAQITSRLAEWSGTPVESAMINDIPGWSWSTVPALALAGIKYLSLGINSGDRIGHVRTALGDQPFYWQGPSGKERVLVWVHESGYARFHYVPKENAAPGIALIETPVLNYCNELAVRNYPYDLVPLHYTIGSDNGPPDPLLAERVRQWNETYVTPTLSIATTTGFFREFEARYGGRLPVRQGDITPYWEDGAASSARETAFSRRSARALTQAGILFSQYAPEAYPRAAFAEAWRQVLLFSEHTWGAWNSVSEPDSPFVTGQWQAKQAFATAARAQSQDLLRQAAAAVGRTAAETQHGPLTAIVVINTTPRPRSGVITLPADCEKYLGAGRVLVDEENRRFPLQLLHDGTRVIRVEEVPPMGSRRLRWVEGKEALPAPPSGAGVRAGDASLANEYLQLRVEPGSGAIVSLTRAGEDANLVDTSHWPGMNGYLYVAGRHPGQPQGTGPASIEVLDDGPLVATLRIRSSAPGCRSLVREVRLEAGAPWLEMIVQVDKLPVRTPEAVHLVFPFRLPDARVWVENAFGRYQVERDQLPGACKNFFTVQQSIEVEDGRSALTLVSPDAPLFETGTIQNDALACGWQSTIKPSATLFAYLMNNYWHTNYCASQEGDSRYRFQLLPHAIDDGTAARSLGQDLAQPLVVVPVREDTPPPQPLFRFRDPAVEVVTAQSALDGDGLWLVLYNPASRELTLHPELRQPGATLHLSGIRQEPGPPLGTSFTIPPRGLLCLRLTGRPAAAGADRQ